MSSDVVTNARERTWSVHLTCGVHCFLAEGRRSISNQRYMIAQLHCHSGQSIRYSVSDEANKNNLLVPCCFNC